MEGRLGGTHSPPRALAKKIISYSCRESNPAYRVGLFPGKVSLHLLDRSMGGFQCWYGHSVEEKNRFPLPGIQSWSLGLPGSSLLTIQTELSLVPANKKTNIPSALFKSHTRVIYLSMKPSAAVLR
jgi:hypothetical protein